MRFLSAAHTDIGITKQINQDSFCLKIAKTPKSNIAFSVLCDGMGGLKKGELASSSVVNTFSEWFENVLPGVVDKSDDFNIIISMWKEIIISQGKKIYDYGHSRGFSLGTTITAILIINDNYVAVNVGDSRIYIIRGSQMRQVTRDHNYWLRLQEMVANGQMTKEEAMAKRQKEALISFLGIGNVNLMDVNTQPFEMQYGDVVMLCSDGITKTLSDEQIHGIIVSDIVSMEDKAKTLVNAAITGNTHSQDNTSVAILQYKESIINKER